MTHWSASATAPPPPPSSNFSSESSHLPFRLQQQQYQLFQTQRPPPSSYQDNAYQQSSTIAQASYTTPHQSNYGSMNQGYGGAQGGFEPGTAGTMATTMVELSISGRDLRDMDVFSKSDPMCVAYIKPFGSNSWSEVKRTERIKNTLNPDFTTKVRLTYLFEEVQHIKFEMYDIDNKSVNLNDHDFIGDCQCTLAQIVTNGSVMLDLINSREGRPTGNGTLLVTSEELSNCKDDLELQFMAKKLDRKDFFGSSDPFLQFSRSNEAGKYTVVHRTEHIKNNLNPLWRKFTVPIRSLCNGDLDRNVKVECFDHNKNGSHSLIGEFFLTVRQLQSGPNDNTVFPVLNPKKKGKKSYKNSGVVHLVHIETVEAFSFLDYIRGGTELACTFSIDFTQSNGAPNDPRSLHYMNPRAPNQYEVAIRSVGDIIRDYDSDKLFPVLGFGARLPPDGRVSHNFYVNGHETNPYCQEISGVLDAYKSCIGRIQLYGPTNFAPTVNHVAEIARNFTDGSQYFILLIITDGIITDMPQTKEAIVAAADLPLSIIIVGVGHADFDAMEELDGDTVRLTAPSGRVASRDIVQFVPFRNFLQTQHGSAGSRQPPDSQMARLHLAKEVLAEVPEQFVSFMKTNRIRPNPVEPSAARRILPPDPETVVGAHF